MAYFTFYFCFTYVFGVIRTFFGVKHEAVRRGGMYFAGAGTVKLRAQDRRRGTHRITGAVQVRERLENHGGRRAWGRPEN